MMKDLQSSIIMPLGLDSSGQTATKSIRLDLPKFQGTDNEGWLFQAEVYFHFQGITDDSRIQIVGFHLTKVVLSWMRGLRRNNLLSTWDKFKEDLRERFGASVLDDKLQELSHL